MFSSRRSRSRLLTAFLLTLTLASCKGDKPQPAAAAGAGQPVFPVEKPPAEAPPPAEEIDEGPSQELPDLQGLAGLDPDTFSPGLGGLDEMVDLWKGYGKDAEAKAAAQAAALAGKTERTAKELAACLPAAPQGWKAAGKTGSSRQQIKGSSAMMAWRRFTGAGGTGAEVAIIDTVGAPDLRAGFELGRIVTQKKDGSRQQPIEVEGEPGYLTARGGAEPSGRPASRGALLVGGRFLVVVKVEGLADLAAALQLLRSVSIGKLRSLGEG